MNTIIAIVVGAAASTVLLVAGVNAQQAEQKNVSKETLYSYSDQ